MSAVVSDWADVDANSDLPHIQIATLPQCTLGSAVPLAALLARRSRESTCFHPALRKFYVAMRAGGHVGPSENSRFKIVPQAVTSDGSLTEDRGWHKMDVRWLITSATMPSRQTVVGKTTMPPGVKAQHAMHRHPNAEEWEYVIQGVGIKRVGKDAFYLRAGDLAFVPRNEYHALENASDTETLVTIWGYCGASSLEEAGYFTPEDDQKGA